MFVKLLTKLVGKLIMPKHGIPVIGLIVAAIVFVTYGPDQATLALDCISRLRA